jgi:hypothetical protein
MAAFKNKNIVRDGPFFTHFATLPFIEPQQRALIESLQADLRSRILSHPKYSQPELLKEHHHNQCHTTLFKLVLRHTHQQQKMTKFLDQHQAIIHQAVSELAIVVKNVNYFTRFNKN